MPRKSTLISAAALVLVVTHDIKTQIETKKVARLFLAAAEAYEETQEANKAQIEILCRIIEKNEIVVDEFDLIALKYHSE